MRMKFHGFDPATCKPGDTGKWEMLEEEKEAKAGNTEPAAPAAPAAGKKRNPAMDYLRSQKKAA